MSFLTEFLAALIYGILAGGVYALIAVGLSLYFGLMGIVNFAHGSIVMLGMYAAYYSFTLLGLHPYLSLVLVIPLFFLFGMALETGLFRFMYKAPHNNQFLLTCGLMIVINNIALTAFTANTRTLQIPFLEAGFSVGGIVISYGRFLAFLVGVVFYLLLTLFLRKTMVGKAIRASAQNREGAKLCGINVSKIFTYTFGLGIMLAGLAGLLILPFSGAYPDVGDTFILSAFIIIVLGGMGKISAAFWASLIIGVAEAMGSTFLSSGVKYLFPFLLFIVVLLFRPTGLFVRRT
ncbi:MAG: branched-chain amino acid ABC transporter permease [Thermodesulfobacteriota bacterium]